MVTVMMILPATAAATAADGNDGNNNDNDDNDNSMIIKITISIVIITHH